VTMKNEVKLLGAWPSSYADLSSSIII